MQNEIGREPPSTVTEDDAFEPLSIDINEMEFDHCKLSIITYAA